MKSINPFTGRKNAGHYSPGVMSHGMLYVSGQLPIDPASGSLVAGDVKAQAAQALNNLLAVVRAAGLTLENVVQCRVYLRDIQDWDAVNEVYGAFFGGHKPARIVVPVSDMHFGAQIEIEAIAEAEA